MIEKQAEDFWEKCAKYVRNEPKEKRFIKGTTTNCHMREDSVFKNNGYVWDKYERDVLTVGKIIELLNESNLLKQTNPEQIRELQRENEQLRRKLKQNCHNCKYFTNVPTSHLCFLYACRIDCRTALTTNELKKGECKYG